MMAARGHGFVDDASASPPSLETRERTQLLHKRPPGSERPCTKLSFFAVVLSLAEQAGAHPDSANDPRPSRPSLYRLRLRPRPRCSSMFLSFCSLLNIAMGHLDLVR